MSSDKRDFTDFKGFGGAVRRGVYCFPTLVKDVVLGKQTRQKVYNVYARCIKKSKGFVVQNWDLDSEEQLPIMAKYYTDGKADTPCMELWAESGYIEGKQTRYAPSYITEHAFKGQSNERNTFQQALIAGRSLYLNKITKGHFVRADQSNDLASQPTNLVDDKTEPIEDTSADDKEINVNSADNSGLDDKNSGPDDKNNGSDDSGIGDNEIDDGSDEKAIDTALLLSPQLAKEEKDAGKHIKYPGYVQPKLDGLRCVSFMLGDRIVHYSRNKKIFPSLGYLDVELMPFFASRPTTYLDGELFTPGRSLQEISGQVRNSSNTDLNQYWIYDCFDSNDPDEPFSDRSDWLRSMPYGVYVRPVETVEVYSMDEVRSKLAEYLITYEGLMFRNNATYKIDSTARSSNLIKFKKKHTDEFKIVDYSQGTKGKDVGAIVWVVETKTGGRFNVVPNGTYEYRYELFADCTKRPNRYIGKMLTVEYSQLSKKGIPQQPKGITIRDYE